MRFNSKRLSTQIFNYEGNSAYKLPNEMKLYSLITTSILSDQFYRKEDGILEELKELVNVCDPLFVMQLGVYAREEMYLRTVPLVLISLLAKNKNLKKELVNRVIQRADELSETIAIYKHFNGHIIPLAKPIKKGLAKAFDKFDYYQFTKYKAANKEVSLRDVMFLVHPKPTKERKELYEKIANNELKNIYTWETELSKSKDKAETWKELILSNRVGYMALLRNLRNILTHITDLEIIGKVAERLNNKNEVLKSKQFPFRFLAAYKEIMYSDNKYLYLLLESLENAVYYSLDNIKGFDYNDNILIAADTSGSMDHILSVKSLMKYYEIGLILSMMLQSKCKSCVTGIFANEFKVKNYPKREILRNCLDLEKYLNEVGGGTEADKVLEYALKSKQKFDKIMFFTDGQIWNTDKFKAYWKEYRKEFPDCKMYFFDLSGYGNTPLKMNDSNVYFISGWSEKIFDILDGFENKEKILEKIKSIKI